MKSDFRKVILKEIQTDSATEDLYDLLPRFVDEHDDSFKVQVLKPIERKFNFKGESFQLFIMPASLEDENSQPGQYRQCFPGSQEAIVESAIIELAVLDKTSSFDGEKKFAFKLSHLHTHLVSANLNLSQEQIEHSIKILAGAAYILISKNTEWIFRTIETLVVIDEGADLQFTAYLGDLVTERIKNYKSAH